MKKTTILAITSIAILGFAANSFAADLFGYPVVEKQVRFYSLILGIIAASVLLVAASCLWSRSLEKRAGRESEANTLPALSPAAHSAR